MSFISLSHYLREEIITFRIQFVLPINLASLMYEIILTFQPSRVFQTNY